MEHELGSVAVDELANFTVLDDDPYAVAPARLNQLPVLGTVYEGR
jgi:predicted amidohydrolase YtcJ